MATHNEACPKHVSSMNTALTPSEAEMLWRMMRRCLAGMADQPRQARQVVSHQGGIRARRPRGDAESGTCHRRRFIHAITQHADRFIPVNKLLDHRDLVLGQQLGANVIHPAGHGHGDDRFEIVAVSHVKFGQFTVP